MNRTLEKLYFSSPVFMQNLAVTAYGLKLYRQRFDKTGLRFLDDLMLLQWKSKEEILEYQETQFLNLAKTAIEHVPFYRNWAKNELITRSDFTTIGDLSFFPIIEKSEIRKDPIAFVDERFLNKKTFKLYTSGTTGTPLEIYTNNVARSIHYAFFARLRNWFNLPVNSKRVTLFGRIIQSISNNSPPFWRHDRFQNNLLMSSYHLNESNLNFYVKKIREYQPNEIFAYPSSIYQIARYINNHGIEPISLSLVMTTAEPLYSYQREMIETAFRAPVINQYGCTEMSFFASECEKGVMHLHPEHGIAETDDSINCIDTNLEKGAFIATGLTNHVMPVFRYKLGDNITIDRVSRCTCGRNYPILHSIDGRFDDVIYRLDGTPVGRLDPIFKGGLGIKEAQLIQNKDLSIDFNIVPDLDYDSEKENSLLCELKKRVGHELKINLCLKETIEKEKNGKFKAVIGKYKPKN